MSFTIPNLADAGFPFQAQVDKVDVDVLVAGHKGDYVVSGCAVTAQGSPDMTVAVAVGAIRINGAVIVVSAGNVTVGAADGTNPRFDLITVNDSGTKACTAGAAAASPVFPAIPANSVVLAAVYVPANDTDIEANQIVDKQVVGEPPIFPFTPFTTPVSGDFSWVNQGGASISATYGGIYLLAPATAAFSWRIQTKAAPATPYVIVAYFLPEAFPPETWGAYGLGWRQSSDGKLHMLSVFAGGSNTYQSSKWTSATAFSASYVSVNVHFYDPARFIAIEDDGTNRKIHISSNGRKWIQLDSQGRTDFLTGDEVFFTVQSGGTYPAAAWLLHWAQLAALPS